MKGFLLLLLVTSVVSGCGRKLPPDCGVVLESGDYDRFEMMGRQGAEAGGRDREQRVWLPCVSRTEAKRRVGGSGYIASQFELSYRMQ